MFHRKRVLYKLNRTYKPQTQFSPGLKDTVIINSSERVIENTALLNSSNKFDKSIVKNISNIYIIGGVNGGGSLKFLHDFKECFPNSTHINSKKELMATTLSVIDTIFLQHLYKTDLSHALICDVVKSSGCRLIISIHDFYYLSLEYGVCVHSDYLHHKSKINYIIKELFLLASHIIHPSKFTADVFSRYFPTNNFIVCKHIDFKILESVLNIHPITLNTINIGILTGNSECKGKIFNEFLSSTLTFYKGYNIKYFIVDKSLPKYDENDFFNVVKKYTLHGLLALNKWGETYGYAMSKYLKSGLPFLYNNIGSFKERVPSKPQYIIAFNEEVETFTIVQQKILQNKFNELLNIIIDNKEPYKNNIMVDLSLNIPETYKFLFESKNYIKILWDKIHTKIKPYAVYFPQFHQILENDINFYPGMTDMTSLCALIKSGNPDNIDTPNLNELNITSLVEYDQSNKDLILRQIELAKKAGICGFSIYYFWFTHNSLSGKNMIFEKCINNFFMDIIFDFKVFFIWANEDWSKNQAFVENSSSILITNEYTHESFKSNFDNLLPYFNHPNYLKIDNCPVFYIHHPWFIEEKQLLDLKHTFTDLAIANGFDGIKFRVSSMNGTYDTIDSFDFCPKYKGVAATTFEEYIGKDNNSSIFFSFNNSARMFKPSKTIITKIRATAKQQKSALNSCIINNVASSQDCFLINSWNEWGENMAIEPGTINGSFYTTLLKQQFAYYLNDFIS